MLNRENDIHSQTEPTTINGLNIQRIWAKVDGVEVISVYNYGAQVLSSMKIYAFDPWYGFLENNS